MMKGFNLNIIGLIKCSVLFFALILLPLKAETLTQNTTISVGDYTYIDDLIVPSGVTLTIDAGAVLRFSASRKLRVKDGGKLFVNGTEAEPVVFTSDGLAVNSWYGLYFEGARADDSEIVIDHAIIEYADKALFTNRPGVKVKVTNSTVRHSNYGVFVDAAYNSAPNHPNITFKNGALYSNAKYNYYTKNFYGTTITTIDATGNWWGSSQLPVIGQSIYDLVDSSNRASLNFDGFLDAEGGSSTGSSFTSFITQDTTWNVLNGAIAQTIHVTDGNTLTIAAGTVLKVASGAELVVDEGGKLLIQGTQEQPVTFTSEAAAVNSWKGIRFEGARADDSEIVIDHAIIEYADKALYTNKLGVKVKVTNSTVRHNNYGVYVDAAFNSAPNHPIITFKNGALYDNVRYNYYTKGFYGNAITTIDATGNWWGSSQLQAIGQSIYDLVDSSNRASIDFNGYLDAEGGQSTGTSYTSFITQDTTWNATDGEIAQPIHITQGNTLTIAAGTVLKVATGAELVVDEGAKLLVQGTSELPVLFTSDAAVVNSWKGIRFEGARANDSEIVIDHAIIEYADKALYTNKAGVKVSVTNSIVRLNNYGVYVDAAYNAAPNHPVISFKSGALYNNAKYNYYTKNFYGSTITTIDVQDNWWGSADLTAIQSSILDLQDSSNKPVIDFSGLRLSANGAALAGTHVLGLIVGNVTVDASDTVFLNPVRVFNGGVLTIAAGTRLAIDDGAEILVEDGGKLFVQGTENAPVIFTHNAGLVNSWKGLRFEGARSNGNDIVIEYAIIEYADKALYTNKAGVKATVTNSTVRHNNYGVYVDAAFSSAPNHPVITFKSGALHNNVNYNYYTKNFYGATVTTIDAKGNWWGSADASVVNNSIYDIFDGEYKASVDFSNLLLSEDGEPLPGTHIMGSIEGENRWQLSDGVVIADTTVKAGAKVIVEAGTQLNFLSGAKLVIEDGAQFSVIGEKNSPVVFTSGNENKAAGDWAGIEVKANNNVHISNAVIEYADKGIYFDGLKASGTITDSTIQFNNYGIFVNGASQPFDNHPTPVVTNNIIQDNVNYDYFAEKFGSASSRTLNARGNYWGTADIATIAEQIYDNTDYSQSPIVDYGFVRGSESSTVIADAGADITGFGTVRTELKGVGSSNTEITGYAWQQYLGDTVTLNNPNSAIADFTVADVESDQLKSFVFTVTDANDISASDKLNVVIKPYAQYNKTPELAESQEMLVEANEYISVTLAAFDADNDPLTYAWQQTSGDAIELSSTDTDTLSFTAPSSTENKLYKFKLVVSDGNYNVERTVSVAVKKAKSATGTYFYHNDHLGTPQVMTNTSAEVVWQADYTPFGEAKINVNTVTSNIRFPGQYYDEESELHYNYFRDYDPELGRYIQSDPIGLAGGINTYGYVYGNPIMYYDPYGLDVWGVNLGIGGTYNVKGSYSYQLMLDSQGNLSIQKTIEYGLGDGTRATAGGFLTLVYGTPNSVSDLLGPGSSFSGSGGGFAAAFNMPYAYIENGDNCVTTSSYLDMPGVTFELGFSRGLPGAESGVTYTYTEHVAGTGILGDIGRWLGSTAYWLVN